MTTVLNDESDPLDQAREAPLTIASSYLPLKTLDSKPSIDNWMFGQRQSHTSQISYHHRVNCCCFFSGRRPNSWPRRNCSPDTPRCKACLGPLSSQRKLGSLARGELCWQAARYQQELQYGCIRDVCKIFEMWEIFSAFFFICVGSTGCSKGIPRISPLLDECRSVRVKMPDTASFSAVSVMQSWRALANQQYGI